MKSRLLRLIIPISLIFFLASCGAMNTVNVDAYKKTKRVALISVFSEESVDTKAVSPNPLMQLATKAAQDDKGTDMVNKMDMVKSHVLKKAPSIFGFKMVPEKRVIRLKSYKSFNDSSKNMSNLVAPKGYKRIFSNEKEIITKVLSQIKGADAAMIMHLKARAGKSAIPGKAVVRVAMTFYLVDKKGELILHKTVDEEADGSIACVYGIFNANELGKKVVQAIDKDLKSIAAWMKEEMKKPVKK